MFLPGQILRFENFIFKNGEWRDKYCIILAKDDLGCLIYTLPSSVTQPQRQISPGFTDAKHTPFYLIPSGQVIGQNGFYFELDTFIYFAYNIRPEQEHVLAHLSATNRIELLDSLTFEFHLELLYKIYKSNQVPRNSIEMVEMELVRLESLPKA